MAVLSREDFFNHLQEAVGEDTSEKTIQFIEDMTDTYNDMEQKANGDGVDWEQRYNELDASWREKYRHRFFSGGGAPMVMPQQNQPPAKPEPTSIRYEDLFS